MTIVRRAEPDDLVRLVEMAVRFAAESEYAALAVVSVDKVTQLITGLCLSEAGAVFVAEVDGAVVGMIGGHVFDHPMFSAVMAQEVAWWVEPTHRTGRTGYKLVKALAQWALMKGASHLSMIAPNDRVASFYERIGFSRAESVHYRRL